MAIRSSPSLVRPVALSLLMSTVSFLRGEVRRPLPALIALLGLAGVAEGAGFPGPSDTQNIGLRSGWNAVFVHLDPVDPAPAAVFANVPVDKVAAYFPTRTPVEFIQDPASEPWKQPGWRAWFAPGLPEAAISDLHAITGGEAYLVHATAAATWTIEGTVIFRPTRWRADSFNFVGFSVDPANPPTIQGWFAGWTAYLSTTRNLVYTLDTTERWVPVARPTTTVIQPNAAYWVFCPGASDYQGPLSVVLPHGVQGRLDFGDVGESQILKLANNLPHPVDVALTLSPATALPLAYEQRLPELGDTMRVGLTTPWRLGPLERGEAQSLRLVLDRAAMSQPAGAAVLTLSDDVGSLIRIPVTGKLP